MEIIASNEGGSQFKMIPAGNYIARCISMIHIGTVEEIFNNKPKLLNKVRLSFETPTELEVFKEENGEQPYMVSKEFTLSLFESATLRKFLESWRGKQFTEEEAKRFDLSVLLGKPCMVNIIHKLSATGKKYVDISSISAMPKGIECPAQINESVIFSISQPNMEVFESLPDFLKEKIKKSQEFKNLQAPHEVETPTSHNEPVDVDEPSDLPF